MARWAGRRDAIIEISTTISTAVKKVVTSRSVRNLHRQSKL
jgi:hypothetical protein